MTRGDEIVAAARRCLGARFRPQGRDPRFGLDCVGVAAIAFGRPLPDDTVPDDYPLRGGSAEAIARSIDAVGLRRIDMAEAAAGDLLLVAAGAEQFHLAILSGRGFIHADAGLRRVVETPGRPEGRILGAWREDG